MVGLTYVHGESIPQKILPLGPFAVEKAPRLRKVAVIGLKLR